MHYILNKEEIEKKIKDAKSMQEAAFYKQLLEDDKMQAIKLQQVLQAERAMREEYEANKEKEMTEYKDKDKDKDKNRGRKKKIEGED